MDSPPTSRPSEQIQCLITNVIFRYLTGVLDYVKHFVFDDSFFPTDEPRLDVAALARLLIVGPILLLLCCLLWVLIVLSGIEWFVRLCVSAVIKIPRSIVRGFLMIGRLCHNCLRFVIGRRSTIESIEDHALWDRWLDG
jgi:hypothetical protein